VRDECAHFGRRAIGRRDDLPHLEPVALGERVVALVVRGHGHDRARPVLHQDVVRDPDRDRLAVDRVDRVAAGEDAVLLLRLAFHGGAGCGVADVLGDLVFVLGARRQLGHERVLGSQDEERRPEQRVGPGREDRQLLARALHGEDDPRTLGAADPVPLHRQHLLGPRLEQRRLVQQRVGVLGDPEEPLGQVPGLDLGATPLAASVDHLLVREHCLVLRTPLDRGLAPVGQALLEEAQEEPLCPAVVLRIGRRDLARPVDRPAHPLHLPADRLDVAVRDLPRVPALADRSIFRGEPEGVVAHRPEHRQPLPAADVREDVAHRVVEDVPHVELARRVREHLEDVGRASPVRGRGIRVRDREGVLGRPGSLPLLLDGRRVVPVVL
jgi:hypothetical protein